MANFGDDYAVRRHWELRDGKVYSGARILRGADAPTFEILNYLYARDAARVYYSFGTIKDADPSSFRALDSGATFGGTGRVLLNFGSYARDKNGVYHYAYTVGKPSVVRLADPHTFQSINGKFGRDEKSAFIEHSRITHARAKSWTPLQGLYSCDDDFCFYGNRRIAGAHRASFICLPSRSGTWAKDKYRYYHCGKEQTAGQYLVEFEGVLNGLGMMRESLALGRL
jgi:hypothetical protein